MRPTRQRDHPPISDTAKMENAKKRVLLKMGQEALDQVRAAWTVLKDAKIGSKAHQKADGMIITLRKTYSQIETRAILEGLGCARAQRVAKWEKDNRDGLQQVERKSSSHAITEEDINFLEKVKSTWLLDEGFPCPHRRPRQYFHDADQKWNRLYSESYVKSWEKLDEEKKKTVKCMKYSTFTQYVHYLYPGLRLTRTETDVCDACIRLDLIIKNPLSSEDDKKKATSELKMHMLAARDQRRAVSDFTKAYVGSLNTPRVQLPDVIIADHIEDLLVEEDHQIEDEWKNGTEGDENDANYATAIASAPVVPEDCNVLILAEDFGQGITMPHYGQRRPSVATGPVARRRFRYNSRSKHHDMAVLMSLNR